MSKRNLVESTGRKGGWIQTYTNRQFWPIDPRKEEVFLEDIAHALSNECRYGGHGPFYSVAQHSVLVAQHVPYVFRRQALMHDASEAYLKDIPKPIKKYLKGYEDLEQMLSLCIGERFGIDLVTLPGIVHEHDDRACFTEKRDIRGPEPAPWPNPVEPWDDIVITPWRPEQAELAFLRMATQLGVVVPL